MRRWIVLLALMAAVRAEDPLEYTGKPMRVGFECSAADAEAAGLSCSEEEPCPVFLELSGIEAAGNRIFVSGNVHFPDAALYSILLSSGDAGKTWNEPHPRIRFAALDQIQFVDFSNGWIAGANALSAPRDPFFLITDDGGRSWKQQPVYEESRLGVIDKFWFDSKTNGIMLIEARYENRNELYETNTGGESWNMRQASARPIPFPRKLNTLPAAWRLRADAPTRAFVIERSDGERWAKIASFLINLGDCKQ